MVALALLSLNLVAALFKSKSRLEAENAALGQQVIVLRRKVLGRVQLTRGDRLFFVQLYRCFPSILKVITIIRPETLVRWHCEGFRRYWRWKSCTLGGRPPIGSDLRALIRRVSQENPLWGTPRVHGELLKLGFAVAQSTVAKYMVRRRTDDPAGQSWATFLRNHAPQIAAMDLFVVPTIGFDLLYALIIVRLARRELNVTAHPTAEWIARRLPRPSPGGLGQFIAPHGIALDSRGDIYIAESGQYLSASSLWGEARSRAAFPAKTGARELIVPASLLWQTRVGLGQHAESSPWLSHPGAR